MGAKVTFNEITKTIEIDQAPDGNGDVLIDVKVDLYSDGKEDWVITENLRKFYFPISAEGGKPLPGEKDLGSTFFLASDWKIRPYDSDHRLIIDGNLYAEDGSDLFLDTVSNYPVRIMQQVSDLVSTVSTGSGLSTEEHDKLIALPLTPAIADGVWDENIVAHIIPYSAATALKALTYDNFITIDSVTGVPGTGWPIGTHYMPSNNLTDALTIMGYGKVAVIRLHTDLIISAAHDVSSIIIETKGIMGTTITFQTGCTADKAAIRYANVEGVITNGDEILIENCSILNLDNFTGIMNTVALGQGAEISFGTWATIIQATAGGDPTNEPELSIGSASVNIAHYAGNLKIKDKTGSNRTVINFDSGNVIIDSTCIAGTIQLLGVGIIEADNSGAGCQVDSDGFLSIYNITNDLQNALDRTLGLVQENFVMDQQIYEDYNGAKLLTSARIRTYQDSAKTQLLATYQVTATWSTGQCTSYECIKQ